MGSGSYYMDTEEVKKIGAKFEMFSGEYDTLMKHLQAVVQDLGVCWKSEDYNKFLSVFEQHKETIDQMGKAYASFGEILTETGANAEKQSAELRDSIR